MKISVIGAGAMGGALIEGLLKGDIFKDEDITVADPCHEALNVFSLKGAPVTSDNKVAARCADIVTVVVKPWLAQKVITEIKSVMDYDRQMLVVIAAGVKSEDINKWLDNGDGKLPSLFLAIPNIAIAVRNSMTFIVPVNASTKQIEAVTGIFNDMGRTIVVEERLLAAGTTLASCGIAYAMRYIRAAVEGGVELGFKAIDAQNIVQQTVKGAVELLQQGNSHPESEIDKVTTPGGVTIKGLNEMEHAGFTSAVIRGLKAGL